MTGRSGARLACAVALALFAGPGHAVELRLPAPASLTGQETLAATDLALAVGPWSGGQLPTRLVSGSLTRQAYRIGSAAQTSQQIMALLSGQLEQAGFEQLFRCDQQQCGGYDFRFALPGLGEPAMHVDLGDYRYLAARKPGKGGDEFVSLLVSRSPGAGYVEITQIRPEGATPTGPDLVATSAPVSAAPGVPGDDTPLAQALGERGRAVLADLVFETGSSALGPGPFQSLTALADFLAANPDARVALVGHTDAQGALATNIALSRRRAQSVRARLIDGHGVAPGRLDAQGVGYLAPLTSNLTEAGRTANRRVEVVLTTTR